ncbi:MAG: tyrosine-type recombinase/integrase [Pseudomonadales bacterium]|nr:tyrosine-type recombinase/integrase [Pseudomonadales bacterium]MBO7005052.1 tyrosine-type recombinase/integrase [Pseudomonadales bacterium]
MGRKRLHNKDLPRHVHLKHGQYYFVVPNRYQSLFEKRWVPLGKTLREAYATLAELPIHDEPQVGDVKSVEDLILFYETTEMTANSVGTRSNKEQYLPSIRAAVGKMRLDQIEKSHARQLYTTLVGMRGRKTAKEVVSLLRHMLSVAEEHGFLAENKLRGMRFKGNPPRNRLVTYEEVEDFIENYASKLLKAYIPLKLITGLDKQSILSLTIHDITDTGLNAVRRKNNSKPKVYPWDDEGQLKDTLERVLVYKQSQPVNSIYLFANRRGQPYLPMVNGELFDQHGHALGKPSGFNSIWNRSMAKWVQAGNERFTEHDLRKTPASATSTPHAQQLLDHHSSEITSRVYQVNKRVVAIQPRPKDEKKES